MGKSRKSSIRMTLKISFSVVIFLCTTILPSNFLPGNLSSTFAVKSAQALEPQTVAAAAKTTATVLSFFNQKETPPDLNLEVALKNFELLKKVHLRLDAIENTLASLLQKVVDLKPAMRKIVASELDMHVANLVSKRMPLLVENFDELGRLYLNRKEMALGQLIDLQRELTSLQGRNPLVTAYALAVGAHLELAYSEALGFPERTLEQIRERHIKALKGLLNDNGTNSLLNTLNYFENGPIADEFSLIMINLGISRLDQDRYQKYLDELKNEKGEGVIIPIYNVWSSIYDPHNRDFRSLWGNPSWQKCAKTHIKFDNSSRATVGGRPFYQIILGSLEEHTNIPSWNPKWDGDETGRARCFKDKYGQYYPKEFISEWFAIPTNNALEREVKYAIKRFEDFKAEKVELYNKRVEVIGGLQALKKMLINSIDYLEKHYDPKRAYFAIAAYEDASHTLKKIENIQKRIDNPEIQKLIQNMRTARQSSAQSIREANQQINQAIEKIKEIQKTTTLDNVIMGLQLLSQSLNTYASIDKFIQERESLSRRSDSEDASDQGGRKPASSFLENPVGQKAIESLHIAAARLRNAPDRENPPPYTLTNAELKAFEALAGVYRVNTPPEEKSFLEMAKKELNEMVTFENFLKKMATGAAIVGFKMGGLIGQTLLDPVDGNYKEDPFTELVLEGQKAIHREIDYRMQKRFPDQWGKVSPIKINPNRRSGLNIEGPRGIH